MKQKKAKNSHTDQISKASSLDKGRDLCITKLNALFLVGTLKSGSDASKNSNTYALSEFLAKHLESIEVQSDFVPFVNYNILPEVYTNVDNDDWPMIFVLASYLSIPFLISLMASVTI